MATFTSRVHLFIVLSWSSHAAALSGFNYSSDHPARFRHDAFFATNTTIFMYSALAVGAIITGADDDVRMVVPTPHRRGKHRVGHLPADLTSCSSGKRGTWMTIYSVASHSYNSSSVLEMNQTTSFGRNRISSNASASHFTLLVNSSEFALRDNQISNCSTGSELCCPILLPLFPVLQVEPIAFVEIVYSTPMCQPGYPSYRSARRISRRLRREVDYYNNLQNHRVLIRPSKFRYRRRRLLQVATHRKLAPSSQTTSEQTQLVVRATIAVSALVALICTVAALLFCWRRRRRSTAAIIIKPETLIGSSPRRFSYGELAAATGNFAEDRRVGRGGFGPVYRGCLNGEQDDRRRQVAVKVLSREQSAQGLKEFQAEVAVISQLRHRNIVRLVGWCDNRRRGLLLVYELVPGGSLHTHLYDPDTLLTWSQRYKIALGLGSALLYLHTDCDQCVVHGDIKPANVMLDASGNAKLGDFGLARLVDHGADPQTTEVVAGTVGYIDPELVSSRRPGAESDVYSFGVVLLEIACGRRPTSSRQPNDGASALPLLASVHDMYDRGVILDAADRRLDGEFDEPQMERLLVIGLWCAHRDPVQRPSISQAMDVLRSPDAKLPVLEAMRGSGQARYWKAQAYGDLSDESSASSLDASTETAYLTPEDSSYLLAEE